MKNPNGYGTVNKLSGKRRRPFMARVTTGWTDDGKAIREVVGYYATRAEAMNALALYNNDPYDLKAKRLTFSEVYELWMEEYAPTLKNDSGIRTMRSAYNHVPELHDMIFADIQIGHLEQYLDREDLSASIKGKIKSMFNAMYGWAMRHKVVKEDLAKIMKKADFSFEQKHHDPFTDADIAALEAHRGTFADFPLICTFAGWRPSELLELRVSDIDLEAWTMQGGMKTKAGENRIVPIHPRIRGIIEDRVQRAKADGVDFLFYDDQKVPLNYDRIRTRWRPCMEALGITGKTPHAGRVKFVTMAKLYGMDEYILKRIVGHAIKDVTEAVYTRREIDQLHKEIQKIP